MAQKLYSCILVVHYTYSCTGIYTDQTIDVVFIIIRPKCCHLLCNFSCNERLLLYILFIRYLGYIEFKYIRNFGRYSNMKGNNVKTLCLVCI